MTDRVRYYIVSAIIWFIRILPLTFARKFADGLAWLLHRVLKVRKDVVEENIRRALPECSDEDLEDYVSRSYRFFTRAGVDWIKIDEVLSERSVEEVGWENLEQFEGNGAVVVSGHFGYWELAAVMVAQRYDSFRAYADRQTNPHANDMIKRHREKYGLETVTGLSGVKKLMQTLNDGGFIGVMGDQRVGENYVYVPFFGRAVRTPRIIPYLARKTNSPVVPMSSHREGGLIQFKLYEPLQTSLKPKDQWDELDLLKEYYRWLEREILKFPTQYFWFHKRWKGSVPLSSLNGS
ncbi:MAG: lysophospholipid acyltransferase family protein [bacterium]